MNSRVFIAVTLACMAGINYRCTRPDSAGKVQTPSYHPMVVAFTSGLVSSESTIRMRFARNFPDSVEAGQSIPKKILEFSPELKGFGYYLDQRTIEFRPGRAMPQGTTFSVRADLNRLFPGNTGSEKTFDFEFHTLSQHLEIGIGDFSPYLDYRPELAYLTGTVITADVADPQEVQKVLYAVQGEIKRPVKWDHEPDGLTHRFTIDSLNREAADTELLIHYNGTPLGATQKGVKTFTVPALGSFRVISHKVIQYPEQHVLIGFSDPVMKPQFLDGLIRFENGTDLRYAIEGNHVLAYPVVRQIGTMKVYVEPGIRNTSGKSLPGGKKLTVVFEEIKPAVQLLGSGVIIPGSDQVLLPFKAVNLKAVDVTVVKIYGDNVAQFLQVNRMDGSRELKRAGRLILKQEIDLISDRSIHYGAWNTFSLNLSELVRTEPGAIYRVIIGFRRKHSVFPCSGEHEAESAGGMEEPDDEGMSGDEMAYWDSDNTYHSSYSYYNYDGFTWADREDPCKPAYYGKRRSVSRNVLASNLGLIAKLGSDGRLHVTATDLSRAEPLPDATVKIYNYQNRLMGEGTTDQQGSSEIALNGKPFLAVVQKGKESGYLKLNDGSAVSYSMFDVSGARMTPSSSVSYWMTGPIRSRMIIPSFSS